MNKPPASPLALFIFILLLLLILIPPPALLAAPFGDDDQLLFKEREEAEDELSLAELMSLAGRVKPEASSPAAAPAAVTPGASMEEASVEEVRAAARDWRLLGDALVASNRMDEAARAYWQAARMNPVNAGYLHYFGFTLLALGDHARGLEVYNEILARFPDARKVMFNIASAYYGLKDYDQAIKYLRDYLTAVRRDPPKALYNMGLFLMANGQHEEAIRWFDRAQERLPTSPFIPAAQIRLYRATGRDQLATDLQSLSEDRFGKEFFESLLNAETLPAFLER